MKRTLLAVCLAALGMGLSTCGGETGTTRSGSGRVGTTSTSYSPNGNPLPHVKDSNDLDNDPNSNDDSPIVGYGHAASASEFHAIAMLIKRYYRAAAADEGAKACSMLLSTFAETVAEEDGTASDRPYLRGKTCPVVLSKLFKLRHHEISAQLPSMKVTLARVGSETALVLLSVSTTPEPQKISVAREGSAWKMKELLDSGMP
jgi:hypothetical protein